MEENVNNEYVENVFERDDDAVEDSLEFWDPVDGLEWPQHPEQLETLEFLAGGGAGQGVVEGDQGARHHRDVHEVPKVPEV